MTTIHDLERTREEVLHAGARGPSEDSIRQFLKMCRMMKVRESVMVAEYGAMLLKKPSMPAEELWLVREQVAMAALDVGDTPLATSCVKAISREFPESMRAQRLQGMYFESTCNWDRAAEVYSDMLSKDPSNEMALKRQVALAKAKGSTAAAIEAATSYLELYCNDIETWEELAELYLQSCLYKMAAFCYEELLMLNPTNFAYPLRYADTLTTMGGAKNLKVARSYYSMAVQLSGGGCLPALLGLCSATAKLKDILKAPSTKKASAGDEIEEVDEHELGRLAAQSVIAQYEKGNPKKLPLVKEMLVAQGLI
mmetsp:Transcript_1186/g.3469  ORF Transcript_1186/g.3469 Transcript_1186/m.3469 type:complete len:311 (+) Transcript_1186:173-1105(+)|eukprot:CAMPEP_0117669746 /NCGR_PEP_ID=MMETSP0804-20121206/12318_1 /TAXON_ID=1074897 /ORGANISM="Tetraselmis astigmatica, Strain CCMP880" /LENGTH=310 /DNA_ID=CAMNT_0005477867 /DNA_START=121 /DNA_END=1053 /DNA_ORIENTATION=-